MDEPEHTGKEAQSDAESDAQSVAESDAPTDAPLDPESDAEADVESDSDADSDGPSEEDTASRSEPASLSPSEKPAPRAKRKRAEWGVVKWARVVAYAVFVCFVLAALAIRSSYVGMKQSALDVGEELGKLGDVGHKTPIYLNGERIFVASSVHNLTVEETLDHAESLCEQGAPIPWAEGHDQAGKVVLDDPTTELKTEHKVAPGRFMMRQEKDGRGVVVCFAQPPGEPPDQSIEDRFRRVMNFAKTGDLEAIGHLRYLYARPSDTGLTQLIAVWTDGPFDFNAMARQSGGDAPGSDPKDMPRPPDSMRLLSATIDEAPYAVRVYQTNHSTSEVAAAYDRDMPKHGWTPLVANGDARVYQKNDITVFVTPTVKDGQVLVSLLHMGSD